MRLIDCLNRGQRVIAGTFCTLGDEHYKVVAAADPMVYHLLNVKTNTLHERRVSGSIKYIEDYEEVYPGIKFECLNSSKRLMAGSTFMTPNKHHYYILILDTNEHMYMMVNLNTSQPIYRCKSNGGAGVSYEQLKECFGGQFEQAELITDVYSVTRDSLTLVYNDKFYKN